MSTLPFDTHAFIKRLQSAGFSEEQAEVITDLQQQSVTTAVETAKHDYHLDELPTKRDLKELETLLRKDMKELETVLHKDMEILRVEFQRQMAENKADLTRWIIGAGFLQTTLIIGVLLKIGKLI